MSNTALNQALEILKKASHIAAFTGAGISVESGIPPFRGETGLWSKYDPIVLDLDYYLSQTEESWKVVKEIFYDFFGQARPNPAHLALAQMEAAGLIKEVITQNIDNLHQEAGSKIVHEFHGNSHQLVCTHCNQLFPLEKIQLTENPPACPACSHLLKPDFIFFGEGIPDAAYNASIEAARQADVFLVIGTTGEVMPACQIPVIAKQNGVTIIEINTEPSLYTPQITDLFLQGKAGEILDQIAKQLIPTI